MKRLLLVSVVALAGCEEPEGVLLTLQSVAPSTGSARGGTRVTLKGAGFTGDTVVTFNGRAAQVIDVSDDELLVRAPSGVAGAVSVEVSEKEQIASLAEAFEYQRLPFLLNDATEVKLDAFPLEGALASAADWKRDGKPDLFLAARGEGVAMLQNDGQKLTQRFLTVSDGDGGTRTFDAYSVTATDFNGDKQVDLFIGTAGKTASVLLLGQGDDFVDASDKLPPLFGDAQRSYAFDSDKDGDLDLLVTASSNAADGTFAVMLLTNDGTGKFTDSTHLIAGPALAATAIAIGDFDRDGDQDLFFSMDNEPCRLFLSDGQGVFQLSGGDALPPDSQPHARQAAVGDLDGDGSLDLYIPTSGQDLVWLNDGTAHFADLTEVHLSPEAQAATAARFVDLDLDGALDVVVVETNRLRFLRNDGAGRLFDYSAVIVGNDNSAPARDVLVVDLEGDGVPEIFLSRGGVARPALFVAPKEGEADTDDDGQVDSLDQCPAVSTTAQTALAPFGCRSNAECEATLSCGLKVRGNSAYLSCGGTRTFAEADEFCRSVGGTLAHINTFEENALLAAGLPAPAWFLMDNLDDGTWKAGSAAAVFFNWAEGEPNNSGGSENCGVLAASGFWNDVSCTSTQRTLCEGPRRRAVPVCPSVVDGGVP